MAKERPLGDSSSDEKRLHRALAATESVESKPTETQTFQGKVPLAGIPKRIGHYHIKRAIASGGMGTVYEATQEKPRRVVAIKLMKRGIASRSAMRRFEYESQILARLRHPCIAQVYEAGIEAYLAGTLNIDDLLKRLENVLGQEAEITSLTSEVGSNVAALCSATGKFFELLNDADGAR